MSLASLSHGWTILSRAFSYSASRQTAATLALHLASRFTSSKSGDFVDNDTKLNTPGDSFIFEDESEDYANVTHHPIPNPNPKVLSTMSRIEAKLPLRLPEPVSGTSIFEDHRHSTLREDYFTIKTCSRKPPPSVLQTLENLIREAKYEDAWEFCQEMLSSGIKIPKSSVYGYAAMAVISSHEVPTEDQISRFSLWLSLIPSARDPGDSDKENIVLMKRHVFHILQPTMTIVKKFSLIMASKGYAESICPEAIMFVMRFSSPRVSLRFIKDFLDADFAYVAGMESGLEEDMEEMEEQRLRRAQELAHLVQGPAIETLTRSGEFAAAMSLLPTYDNPYRLSTRTYDLLLARLRDTRLGSFPDFIHLVEKLYQDPLYSESPKTPSYREIDTWKTAASMRLLKALERELDPQSPTYMGESLAAQLKSILDDIREFNLSASDLSTFFAEYYDSGRTTAILPLKKLALWRNWPTGSIYLYAEMSYYLNNGFYLLVLRNYADHFYYSGVPEDEVTAAIRYLQTDQSSDHSHPAYSIQQFESTRKRIPTESHTDLAWHALARAVPTQGADELYRRFIQYQLDIRDGNAPEDTTRLCFPPSIEHPIGASVFTVFFSRLLRPDQPGRASDIFRDMVKVGVNPAIHHYTQLATFYVQAGDMERAFAIVRALEQEHPVESPTPMEEDIGRIHRQRPGPGIPAPDVVFYASILYAFVGLGYLNQAKEIRRLFLRRFTYTPNLHQSLEVSFIYMKWLQEKADRKRVFFMRQKFIGEPQSDENAV